MSIETDLSRMEPLTERQRIEIDLDAAERALQGARDTVKSIELQIRQRVRGKATLKDKGELRGWRDEVSLRERQVRRLQEHLERLGPAADP